jgi:hypothetical protein
LLFLILITKYNIYYVTIKLARYASNPNKIHFRVIKRIFRYLKKISELKIIYYNSPEIFIQRYYDIDYINNLASVKSINNYIIFIAGRPFI